MSSSKTVDVPTIQTVSTCSNQRHSRHWDMKSQKFDTYVNLDSNRFQLYNIISIMFSSIGYCEIMKRTKYNQLWPPKCCLKLLSLQNSSHQCMVGFKYTSFIFGLEPPNELIASKLLNSISSTSFSTLQVPYATPQSTYCDK